MRPHTPCLDCGAAGPWRDRHGLRCPRCEAVHGRKRRRQYRPLERIPIVGLCVRCGTGEDLTWDHIVPLAKGGTGDWSNLQVLCRRCNSAKGDRPEKAIQGPLKGYAPTCYCEECVEED